jgi:hypothetical protein
MTHIVTGLIARQGRLAAISQSWLLSLPICLTQGFELLPLLGVPPVRVLDADDPARYVRAAAILSKFAGHMPRDTWRFRHCHIATLD